MVHDDNKVKRMSKYEGVNNINNGARDRNRTGTPVIHESGGF